MPHVPPPPPPPPPPPGSGPVGHGMVGHGTVDLGVFGSSHGTVRVESTPSGLTLRRHHTLLGRVDSSDWTPAVLVVMLIAGLVAFGYALDTPTPLRWGLVALGVLLVVPPLLYALFEFLAVVAGAVLLVASLFTSSSRRRLRSEIVGLGRSARRAAAGAPLGQWHLARAAVRGVEVRGRLRARVWVLTHDGETVLWARRPGRARAERLAAALRAAG